MKNVYVQFINSIYSWIFSHIVTFSRIIISIVISLTVSTFVVFVFVDISTAIELLMFYIILVMCVLSLFLPYSLILLLTKPKKTSKETSSVSNISEFINNEDEDLEELECVD